MELVGSWGMGRALGVEKHGMEDAFVGVVTGTTSE